jgi:predicted metalloprotease with PDZ domain
MKLPEKTLQQRPWHQALRSLLIALVTIPAAAAAPAGPIQLFVDATDAPRNIFHARLLIPAAPGDLTLVYPKWIPGNHRPSGPIANLTGLHFQANGKPLTWERDPLDMYAFHMKVPAGAHQVEASLDAITADSAGADGAAASSQLLDLNWNQVVLYTQNTNSDELQVQPNIHLPAGWKLGSALTVSRQEQRNVAFEPVSLTTLVDSPLIAGAHYRQILLTQPGENPPHYLDMVAETEAALDMPAADLSSYKQLVAEANVLFGARHYRQYHFLYTLSDDVGHHGLEHHESSDNAVGERTLLEPDLDKSEAGLLPHEFTHSWNGKYRRPAGLATRNYQDPMIGDLLWVYEGLTEYLGDVLTARSGLWTPEEYRESLADTAASLDYRAGRTWRPLQDTARSVQILRMVGPEWGSWRRGLDYYPEGELIWLEVDTRIRQLTQGKQSLDDFCHKFHGGQDGPPRVVPYSFEDVVHTLNEVAPFDWAGLLRERLNTTQPRAPLGGIENGGWKLVYDAHPNKFASLSEKANKTTDFRFSLGFWIRKDGGIGDVIPGSPAYAAGLGPGLKLIAVNGRHWKGALLKEALRTAQSQHQPIELIVENKERFATYSLPYFDGERYPHLQRVESRPDLLTPILAAHSTSPR